MTGCMLFPFDQTIEYRIDPLLQPYLNEFYKQAEQRGFQYNDQYNLIMIAQDANTGRFVDQDNPKVLLSGLSIMNGDQRIVYIDKQMFEFADDTATIEAVVFHELGHALIRRKHCNCYSIMNNDVVFDLKGYKNNRDILLDELFNNYN